MRLAGIEFRSLKAHRSSLTSDFFPKSSHLFSQFAHRLSGLDYLFVYNFSPTILCPRRGSNPHQSVELHRLGSLKGRSTAPWQLNNFETSHYPLTMMKAAKTKAALVDMFVSSDVSCCRRNSLYRAACIHSCYVSVSVIYIT